MWLHPPPSHVADEPNTAVTAGCCTLARVDCQHRGRSFPGHPGMGRGPSSPAHAGCGCGGPGRSGPSHPREGGAPSGTYDSDAAGSAGVAAPATPQPAAGAGMAAPRAPTPPATCTRTRFIRKRFEVHSLPLCCILLTQRRLESSTMPGRR